MISRLTSAFIAHPLYDFQPPSNVYANVVYRSYCILSWGITFKYTVRETKAKHPFQLLIPAIKQTLQFYECETVAVMLTLLLRN